MVQILVHCSSRKFDLADTVRVEHFLSILAQRCSVGIACVCAVAFPLASGSSTRDPGAAPPTRNTPALSQAAEAVRQRSIPLGTAVPVLERLAFRSTHRPARNCDRLASQRIPPLLDSEGPLPATRTTAGLPRNQEIDSPDEPRQPALGRASHPWRIAETRDRCRRDER